MARPVRRRHSVSIAYLPDFTKLEGPLGVRILPCRIQLLTMKRLAVVALIIASASIASSQGYGPEKALNFGEYITVHNGTRHMWYWFFESRSSPATDPFVLWLTGGPGCSSLVALFYENGPYIIQNDLSLKLNPYSWNARANVMWVDQPVNTGFSYTTGGDIGVVTEQDMADNMYELFQKFFAKYPKYVKLAFHITGESYAGHYIPALAARIYEGNVKKEGLPINLKGLAIGNGLVNPLVQYTAYAQYAYDHKVVKQQTYEIMKTLLPVCLGLIENCAQNSTIGWLACINAYVYCNYAELIPVQFTGVNVYDVRVPCGPNPLCYNFSLVNSFLKKPDVKKALNVEGRTWTDCNRIVDLELVFAGDWMLNFADDIPQLLASNISVLVYNGEYDFIVNWYGSEAWANKLKWPGQDAFNRATNTTWRSGGEEAGSARTAQLFTFLRVKDAGHMVPLNQPARALDMLQRFVDRKPFN